MVGLFPVVAVYRVVGIRWLELCSGDAVERQEMAETAGG